jgi:UDP-N-acetylglucosamine:LPS N-acetylglucosamine transferase
MRKPTIGIFTTSQGHYSLAQAAAEALSADYSVQIFKAPIVLENFYLLFYRSFPHLFQVPFQFAQISKFKTIFNEWLAQKYSGQIEAFVQDQQLDLCISTYFALNSSLSHFCHQKNLNLINIISDPKTIHSLLPALPPAINLTFDSNQSQSIRELEPTALTLESGWFVRKAYQPVPNKNKVRAELELDPDLFTVLMVNGSEGSTSPIQTLPYLLKNITFPMQCVIACGHNQILYSKVSELVSKYSSEWVKVKIIGFTNNLHSYMQAADIVAGKAGPNTLFEAVATHTPFLAIEHISGQEDGNLELIDSLHLGWVQENPAQIPALLTDLVENPIQLRKIQTQLQSIAIYNQQASVKLVELVEKLLKK